MRGASSSAATSWPRRAPSRRSRHRSWQLSSGSGASSSTRSRCPAPATTTWCSTPGSRDTSGSGASDWLYGPDRRLIELYNKSLNMVPMHELPHYRITWQRNLARHQRRDPDGPGEGRQGDPQAPEGRWAAVDGRLQRAQPCRRLVVGADPGQPRGHGGPVRHRPDRHRAPGGQSSLLRPHGAARSRRSC